MSETFVRFQKPVAAPDGSLYVASACGGPMSDGMWQGWLEFAPLEGDDEPIRSKRETTQPNRVDTLYWATGLTAVYLEGSLKRALDGPIFLAEETLVPPTFNGPMPSIETALTPDAAVHSVLDPFSVYQKGESLLRKQLAALSAWHLVNIIREYDLSELPIETLNTLRGLQLIEIIVSGVRSSSISKAR